MATVTIKNTATMTEHSDVRLSFDLNRPLRSSTRMQTYNSAGRLRMARFSQPTITWPNHRLAAQPPFLPTSTTKQASHPPLPAPATSIDEEFYESKIQDETTVPAAQQYGSRDIALALFEEGIFCFHDVLAAMKEIG